MPPTLYLIDGHGLAYRTYFALTAGTSGSDRWQTSSGESIAGVYGFASVLLRILEQDHPDYLAVAFDTGKTFRDDMYPDYKATRTKMPEDLRNQMKRIRQLVDAFSIPRLEVESYEADDVLGSVARQASTSGLGSKIITGDRDLLQLVNDRVVVNLAGAKLSDAKDYLREDVLEYLGVWPEQVVDYKALVGDVSDNIPGVAGIGEKTAIALLKDYPTLEEIYAHLEDLPNRVRTRLETGRDNAYLSQKLARIITDVPVTLDLEKARTGQYDPQAIEALFRELEFRSLVARFTAMIKPVQAPVVKPATQQLSLFGEEIRVIGEPAPRPTTIEVEVVDTPARLDALAKTLRFASRISFDTETTSTDPIRADLVGVSLAVAPGKGYYIPVGHQDGSGEQLPLDQALGVLAGPLTDPHIAKIGHNVKYDLLVLKRLGLNVAPLTFDTMIAEWLINPASRNLGLKNLAWIRLEAEMTHIEELIGKGKNQLNMSEVPIEAAASYAAADAETTLRLMEALIPDIKSGNCERLLNEIEMPLVPVLADMELAGIAVDVDYFRQMSEDLRQRLAQIELNIYEAVGTSFNLNSPQQLSTILFERLRLEPPDRRKRTASGHFSTSADILDELRGQHSVVDSILEYRELSKLKSTYVDALPAQINPATGRIHTSYSQTGSVTGRLASSEPNLQNIPTRTELGRRVRNGFIAGLGKVLLSVDYSQIELRLVAVMSGDEGMLAAFRAGQDIHAATAAAIYGVPLDRVTREQRRSAKSINFGLIYGISAFGLSRQTGQTLGESENFSKAYFQQFPGVKRFLDGIRRQAAQQGYVETMLGRRRYFPGLKNQTNANLRAREEREAINAPVQGTAADIMKIAMIRVPEALAAEGLTGQMLLQVHDELVIECNEAELERTVRVVREVMESAYPLSIPLSTEARFGYNWGELKPLPAGIS
ncbi:MAG TPA: DNA polymerase I [Anaerolineaceae bacterium]|nr:DNA polymerase I [Anaerolineaceae bacterium]